MKFRKKHFTKSFVVAAYREVIGYLFFLILAAMLFMGAVSTSYITASEKILYLPDSVLKNFIIFAVVLLSCAILHPHFKSSRFLLRIEEDVRLFKKIKAGMLCVCTLIPSLYALCTQLTPGGDQIMVLNAAYGLTQKDFSALSPVNYLYDYNHQVGLAFVETLLNRLVGEQNYTAYHLINSVVVALIYKNISEIGALFGLRRVKQLILILLGILFLPLSLYVPFIYGTLPGLLFSLIAIKLELIYFSSGKWWHGLVSSMSICFAVLLKSNYLIFMIGMLIFAVVEVIRKQKFEKSLIIPFIIVLYVAQAIIPLNIFSHMRGADIPKGVSTWAWVTMGLQEGDNAGWYNGYTLDTLIGSEFDTHRQEIWVKSDLKARIGEFLNDPDYAREFFVRKTASQWNEPSFQGIQISQNKEIGSSCRIAEKILSSQGNHAVTGYLNYLNFVIVAGALLYLFLYSKSAFFHDSLILAMIIIGGFIFHLVWEAKGQYTLPYFVLLLPYTVIGYSEAANIISCSLLSENKTFAVSICQKRLVVRAAAFIVGILIIWFIFHGILVSITNDGEIYFRYLEQLVIETH